MKNQSKIKNLVRGQRKDRSHTAREPKLEESLVHFFKQAREAGQKINKQWMVRHARRIYGEMYPQRVIETRKKTKYLEMTFSSRWFNVFKRRNNAIL